MQYNRKFYFPLQSANPDWQCFSLHHCRRPFLCLAKCVLFPPSGMVFSRAGLENRERPVASSEKIYCAGSHAFIRRGCLQLPFADPCYSLKKLSASKVSICFASPSNAFRSVSCINLFAWYMTITSVISVCSARRSRTFCLLYLQSTIHIFS